MPERCGRPSAPQKGPPRALAALPHFLRHGFQGLRDAADAAAPPWN